MRTHCTLGTEASSTQPSTLLIGLNLGCRIALHKDTTSAKGQITSYMPALEIMADSQLQAFAGSEPPTKVMDATDINSDEACKGTNI